MFRFLRKSIFWLFLIFILPALASIAWWAVLDRPSSWRVADWSSAGILPEARNHQDAIVHVMVARTGGLKGALAQHSWIVTKQKGQPRYNRYDKVGWGSPVRKNAYAADGRWYSNVPQIIKTIKGDAATKLIPKIESAIAKYPHSHRGGYNLWPGPNSNSFIAHVLREVPEIGIVLPPNAVGRDYIAEGKLIHIAPDKRDIEMSLYGYAGISLGYRSGFEVNFLGLVTGIDVQEPALKLPGFGRIEAKNLFAKSAFAN